MAIAKKITGTMFRFLPSYSGSVGPIFINNLGFAKGFRPEQTRQSHDVFAASGLRERKASV